MATFADLKEKLLGIGGTDVFPLPNPNLDVLLDQGSVYTTDGLKVVEGHGRGCEANTAFYYVRHYALHRPGRVRLVRGYAMSAGAGYWRQHCWLWDGRRVLETGTAFDTYFGVTLDPDEARRFAVPLVLGRVPGCDELAAQSAA